VTPNLPEGALLEQDAQGFDWRGREDHEPEDYDWLTAEEAGPLLRGDEVVRVHVPPVPKTYRRGDPVPQLLALEKITLALGPGPLTVEGDWIWWHIDLEEE